MRTLLSSILPFFLAIPTADIVLVVADVLGWEVVVCCVAEVRLPGVGGAVPTAFAVGRVGM